MRVKRALEACSTEGIQVYLTWVRAHIGIQGNEIADRAANEASWKGDITRVPQIATPSGIKAASKALKSQWRFEPSYGAAFATGRPGRPQRGPEAAWTGYGSAQASPE